jgi:ribosomal protein S8
MAIEVDFQKYLPNLSTFYSFFEILKDLNYIQDVQVIQKEGKNLLKVFR